LIAFDLKAKAMESLAAMTVSEICDWLTEKGISASMVESFEGT